MYPEESRDILELVLIQIKKSIRQIENGEETNPSQEKVDELIQAAKKAMEDFKATVIIEYVSVAAELYVDGQNDGILILEQVRTILSLVILVNKFLLLSCG